MISTAVTAFPKEIYSSVEEHEERLFDDEEARAGKRVRKGEVWREVLATSTGRDKALVCYSLYWEAGSDRLHRN